jgi:hypothetical protein
MALVEAGAVGTSRRGGCRVWEGEESLQRVIVTRWWSLRQASRVEKSTELISNTSSMLAKFMK